MLNDDPRPSLPAASRFCAFGPYVLDRQRGMLWHDQALVSLTPRAFEILSILVEHRGQLLEKDALIKRVWGNTVVEENNLARHVSTLRKALGEKPGQKEYVATVPGIGYRFVATVTELEQFKEPAGSTAGLPVAPADSFDVVPVASSDAPFDVAAAIVAPRRRQWGPGIVVIAAAIGVVAAVGFVLARGGAAPASAPRIHRTLQQFTYGTGVQQEPAWSPDGSLLAFASIQSGNSDLWVRRLDASEPTQLTRSPAHDWQPDWSPEGSRIAFRSERDGGGLYTIGVSAGDEQQIAPFGWRPRWSPDGKHILFSNAAPNTAGAIRFHVVDPSGRAQRALKFPELTAIDTIAAGWHPDGRVSFFGREGGRLAFVTIGLDGGVVQRSEISSAVQEQISAAGVTLSSFVWGPTARFLYFEGQAQQVRNLWRVSVDPSTLAWRGDLERLTTGPGNDGGLAISPDGRRLAFSSLTDSVSVWSFHFDPVAGRIDGTGKRLTSGETGEQGADAWSDGERLVYRTVRRDHQEVWERTRNQTPRLLISSSEWLRTPPRWSPDGTRLAYQRGRRNGRGPEAARAVAIFSVDRNEEQLVTTPGEQEVIPTDWASDGRSLLASCRIEAGEPLGTCTLPVSGSASVSRLSSHQSLDLLQQRFSPDQRWISFVAVPANDRSVATVYVMAATGGEWKAITDGNWYDDKPRWSPDGQTLYFVSNRAGRLDVWGRRFDRERGEPIGNLFRVTGFESGEPIMSPILSRMETMIATKKILLPMYEATGSIWTLDQIDR